jgi:membrane-bound lytic murein transglycosylase D
MKPIPLFAVLLGALSALPAAARTAGSPIAQAVAPVLQALPPAEVPAAELVEPQSSIPAPAPNAPKFDDEDLSVLFARMKDEPDEPAIAEEIDRDSAEIEAVRQAEEAAAVPDPTQGDGRIELIPELEIGLAELQSRYDIPIDVNAAVVAYIRLFQSPGTRAHFAKWLSRSHKYLDRYRAILKENGLPEDTVYLAMIESGFGNFAYSRARASGPWQFMAATGKHFGLRQDFWVDERRDPEKSARAAARYLKELRQQTGDWRLAWAGYNTGVGRIRRAQRNGYADFWEMADTQGKKVLHPETKGYVPKLMAAAIIAKHPEAFGFRPEDIEPHSWTEYQEVEIPSATLLSVVAEAADVSERALIDLNPELRRASTPPRPYKLKIPVESAERFAEAWPAIRTKVRLTFAGHTVRKGDTLSSIAHAHGVPMQGIVEMNNLRNARKLRVGQELMIPRPVRGGALLAAGEQVREPAVRKGVHARLATPARQAERDRATHRVKSGETLWSISRRFDVAVQELARWNGIKNPSAHKLLAGARLVVRR